MHRWCTASAQRLLGLQHLPLPRALTAGTKLQASYLPILHEGETAGQKGAVNCQVK